MEEIIENIFYDISIILAKDFATYHSFNQSPQIPRVDDPILSKQLSLTTLGRI